MAQLATRSGDMEARATAYLRKTAHFPNLEKLPLLHTEVLSHRIGAKLLVFGNSEFNPEVMQSIAGFPKFLPLEVSGNIIVDHG